MEVEMKCKMDSLPSARIGNASPSATGLSAKRKYRARSGLSFIC